MDTAGLIFIAGSASVCGAALFVLVRFIMSVDREIAKGKAEMEKNKVEIAKNKAQRQSLAPQDRIVARSQTMDSAETIDTLDQLETYLRASGKTMRAGYHRGRWSAYVGTAGAEGMDLLEALRSALAESMKD